MAAAQRSPFLRSFAKHWMKPLTLIALMVPGLWLIWLWVQALTFNPVALGFDPVARTHHYLGDTALRILIVSLMISPLRDLTKWAPLLQIRRRIGLAVFFYALAHVAAYLVFDLRGSFPALWEDVVERIYITLGMAAFLMLIPLAVTSNNTMIKRMGALAWRRLHTLVYPVAVLAVFHYGFMVKGVQMGPWIHGAVIALLLGYRAWRGISRPDSSFRTRLRQVRGAA
ncbi:MAG: sulfoxide reductase heme-binding subunit YedZ [Maricaulis sp.]|jgi:sulfoxide reductase heme-binding subunit YedZ|nr:sulfoxide reductase heme-binding subunit YedZ [Maricaulis sp.]